MIEFVREGASRVGGVSELARRIGSKTSQALYRWTQVPSHYVLAFERETGIPRSELRPDLYPNTQEDENGLRMDTDKET